MAIDLSDVKVTAIVQLTDGSEIVIEYPSCDEIHEMIHGLMKDGLVASWAKNQFLSKVILRSTMQGRDFARQIAENIAGAIEATGYAVKRRVGDGYAAPECESFLDSQNDDEIIYVIHRSDR